MRHNNSSKTTKNKRKQGNLSSTQALQVDTLDNKTKPQQSVRLFFFFIFFFVDIALAYLTPHLFDITYWTVWSNNSELNEENDDEKHLSNQ
jgi:hypothetical protein